MLKAGPSVEEEDARELKLDDDFVKAKCLMNAEVALILTRKYDQLMAFSDDAPNEISQVFEKSLQYVKRVSRYSNPEAVKQVKECAQPEPACRVLGLIGNLCPETMEEAKAVVPSIAKIGRMDVEKIEQMVSDMATITTFE